MSIQTSSTLLHDTGQQAPVVAQAPRHGPNRRIVPTGVERFFDEHELIVSKTDTRGHITYANTTFLNIAGYTEDELIGAPHSILRHPDMPRAVFKLMWSLLPEGQEVFAYVVNMTKHGDHYWVFAHVTPTWNEAGEIIGYHSNRRVPRREAVDAVKPIYQSLCAIEAEHSDRKAGLAASMEAMQALLRKEGLSYDEFVFTL